MRLAARQVLKNIEIPVSILRLESQAKCEILTGFYSNSEYPRNQTLLDLCIHELNAATKSLITLCMNTT
jgi:hypothetical protein